MDAPRNLAEGNIDLDRLAELEKHLGRAVVMAIVGDYLGHTRNQVAELTAAAAIGNERDMSLYSHGIKGGSATVGAAEVHRIAAEMDQSCKAKRFDEVPSRIGDLAAAFDAADAGLRRIYPELG